MVQWAAIVIVIHSPMKMLPTNQAAAVPPLAGTGLSPSAAS
jgi:hypothetical protein